MKFCQIVSSQLNGQIRSIILFCIGVGVCSVTYSRTFAEWVLTQENNSASIHLSNKRTKEKSGGLISAPLENDLPRCRAPDPKLWTDCVGEIEIKVGQFSGAKVKAQWLLGLPKISSQASEDIFDQAIEKKTWQGVLETIATNSIINPNIQLEPRTQTRHLQLLPNAWNGG